MNQQFRYQSQVQMKEPPLQCLKELIFLQFEQVLLRLIFK
ncbi:hypothetical protein pb186bvf_020124 [Paramecium bursaria]